MLRKYASFIVALVLVMLVIGACVVRSGPPRRGGPAYRQTEHKHKKQKKPKKWKH